MSDSKTRIYVVARGNEVSLVRATHRSQALSHVAQRDYKVEVASQNTLVEALGAGIKIDTAGAPDQEALNLEMKNGI